MMRSMAHVQGTSFLRALGRFWKGWGRSFVMPLALFCLFRSAVAETRWVPSGSMKPTILEGDLVLVDNTAFALRIPFTSTRLAEWADPRRGDIVTFPNPVDERLFVKRVVGVPGDVVALRGGRLWLNGAPVPVEGVEEGRFAPALAGEPAGQAFRQELLPGRPHPLMTWEGPGPDFGPVRVPAGSLFVMGDHRNRSWDSRSWGFLDARRVWGRALRVGVSVDPSRWFLPRWERFFDLLD